MKKRLLSFVMALAVLLSLAPVTAFAADGDTMEPQKITMQAVAIGGINYYFADAEGAAEDAEFVFTISSRAGSTDYSYKKAELTQLGDTKYVYIVAPGATALSGTLYGYTGGTATTYKAVYGDLKVETDASYDAISSATNYSGHHVKDIPSFITFGTDAEGNKAITGMTLGRSVKTVEADKYVMASILKAAGETLTAEQEEALQISLKANPMSAPSEAKIAVKAASAEYTDSSRYGVGEFVIYPDETVEGYVWSEYWSNVYAATISDGKTTAGAVHWIDLYGEAATAGPHYNKLQIAINNGTSKGSNEADVKRYAAFFGEDGNIRPGTYTINVYAEGYDTLTTEVVVPESGYVLMNIPYAEFYAAEGIEGVDAVSSSTVKTFNQNMAGGSYHNAYTATADQIKSSKILGVTYPVYVKDMAMLKDYTEVTDESKATITVATGKSTTEDREVVGKDLLFASGDYAYYKLSETPSSYKDLSVEGEKLSFGKATAAVEELSALDASVSYNGHYTDVTVSVKDDEHITGTTVVNAITLTADGETYALRHVEDVWRKTELGWNWDKLDGKGLEGKTITNITYYVCTDGAYHVYSYATDIAIKKRVGEISAEFEGKDKIVITGLPADITNPVATVSSVVGRGETPVVIAENVPVVDGKVQLTAEPAEGTSYNVKVVSDAYADAVAVAIYAASTIELTDGTYAINGFDGSAFGMFGTPVAENNPKLVVKGDDAYIILTYKKDKLRYDQIMLGKYDDVIKTGNEEGIKAIITNEDDLIACTYVLPMTKEAVLDAAANTTPIYYVVRYCKGYSETHDGDWYKAKSGEPYYFTIGALEKISDSTEVPQAEEPISFDDVQDPDAWFYNDVYAIANYKNANGTRTMSGYANTNNFGPADDMNRASFAVMLHRLADEPDAAFDANAYGDVKDPEDFFATAVMWAKEAKVITGYENGNFGPSDKVTRQQIATILYRYAKDYAKVDVETAIAKADLSQFPDEADIADFAKEGMKWAVGAGIISGKEPTPGTKVLDPNGNALRAEVAAMFMRYIKYISSSGQ